MPQLESLIEVALDPSTDPAYLHKLAYFNEAAVRRAARRNPSVPEIVWRKSLFIGEPEAWSNPMAPFYLLTWTPLQNELISLEGAARLGAHSLWRDPHRYSPEGKDLLMYKLTEWWATSTSASDMIKFLGEWAEDFGEMSAEHREAVRILLLCIKTMPNLTTKDQEAIGLLEAWSQGGADERKKAKAMKTSNFVQLACQFACHHQCNPGASIENLLQVLTENEPDGQRKEARAQQESLLADLIRQEMPLPATLPTRAENH